MTGKNSDRAAAGGKVGGGPGSASGRVEDARSDSNLFEHLVKAWIEQCRLLSPQTIARAFGVGTDSLIPLLSQSPAQAMPLFALLAQAHLLCMSSGLRFAGRFAETITNSQARMFDVLRQDSFIDASDGEKNRILIDEARACLREIVELCAGESKSLQSKMLDIDEAMRAMAGEPSRSAGASQRRGRVKSS